MSHNEPVKVTWWHPRDVERERRLLFEDYLSRLSGRGPKLIFEDDAAADHWLSHGLPVQPYHYSTYKGRPFNRADELDWLRQLPPKRAYCWACTGRDKDILIDRIDSKYAVYWAKHHGDRDIMRAKIKRPADALKWAVFFGEKDLMRHLVTDPEVAVEWARRFRDDKEYMRQFIVTDEAACMRAASLGDREIMQKRVTDPDWKRYWDQELDSSAD